MTNLNFLSIDELKALLRNKTVSSKELVQYFLDRISQHSELNAFLDVWNDSAINAAIKVDSEKLDQDKYPLAGIPIAVKDIFTTEEGFTTCGSKFLAGYRAPYTATSIKKLTEAGAIVIGKTNLDEFAMGSSTENSAYIVTKNPWDKSRVPGGSSGGSAAAVAANLSAAAIGTDTGGSIRQPASYCGITGFKPTYGRISRYGMVAYASSLDQAGPFALNAKDCALISRVMAGVDPADASCLDRPMQNWEIPIPEVCKDLRVGIPDEYFIEGLDPEVAKAIETAIVQFEKLGAKRVKISLPHTENAIAVYYLIASAEASSNLARFDGIRYGNRHAESGSLADLYVGSRSHGFGKEVQRRILIGTYILSSGYYDAYYARAQKVRRLIQSDFAKAFSANCDIIICPTAPTCAFKIGENTQDPLQMYLNDIYTVPASLAGIPGLNLPCGFSKSGLPIGIQLLGAAWDEHRLLSVGQAYQNETNWHKQFPKDYVG